MLDAVVNNRGFVLNSDLGLLSPIAPFSREASTEGFIRFDLFSIILTSSRQEFDLPRKICK